MIDKINFEKLTAQMQHFLDFPKVEQNIKIEADRIVEKVLLSKVHNGNRSPIDVLTDYLQEDTEERLKIITGFSGGFIERLHRIYKDMFSSNSWGDIKNAASIRRRIAAFLITPANESSFIPLFVRSGFMLPANWIDLLQDRNFIESVVRGILIPKYSVQMGYALENKVREVVRATGFQEEKGQVEIVDNKEVDIVVPNTYKPKILIMCSYQLTTASSQTSRANEQARMYQDVQTHNRRKKQRNEKSVLFINIIDGGGWLARPNDLKTMWTECDYCFSYSSIAHITEILNLYRCP